jgi:hypothetical protein
VIGAGNGGAEATTAEVKLFYNGGKSEYRTQAMLSPGQQLWLDVGHLVRDQVPDSDGHTLPVSTMTGSYELRDLDHQLVGQLFEGKLVIDKTYGHASYGCGGCCGYTVPYIDPNPFDGPPDEDSDDYIYSTENCGGSLEDVTDDGYDWGSSNTAVALLPNRTLETVAVGTATGSAEIELEFDNPKLECPDEDFNPDQPVTVSTPDHLSVIVDQEGYPAQCPTTGVYVRQMQMQVVDVNNNPVTTGVSVAEAFSNQTSNSCPGAVNPNPSSCGSISSGQFIDTMSVSDNLCNSGIKQSSGCGYSLTSTWSACITSTKTLWVSPRVTLSNSVKVDGSLTQWPAGTQCTSSGCQ